MSHRTKTILAAAALVLLGAAAWFNSFRGAFVFDDTEAIVRKGDFRALWPPGPILAEPRPVVDLTFAVNYALGGLRPAGYHAVNLAIHLLAALALFGVLRRTLLQCRLPIADCRMTKEKAESTANGSLQEPLAVHSAVISQHSAIGNRQSAIACALAFCAALLWLVHPLQTQAVTYVTQRMESLMGLFYLLTLYALIRAATVSHVSHLSYNSHVLAWCAAAVAACALGMGCKEVMVTAPLALLLYDRTFLAGSFREALRRRWGLYLALAATWLILARSILAAFSPNPLSAGFAVPGLTPSAYALSEPGVILHYLRLAFWPGGLCLDYGWPIARTAAQIAPGAIVVGALLAAALWAFARRSAWGFAGAWFFLALAPTSSFMPIQDLAFEHRMYLSLAAPVAAAVVAAYLLGERLFRARKPAGWALAILLMFCATAALSCLTFLRNADYRSAVSIWQDAARKRPENPRAWNYLGAAWVEDGRPENALACFDKAMEIRPGYAAAYNNRAAAYGSMGRWDLALRDSDEAVRLSPDDAPNRYNRGKALAALNRRAEAIRDYTEAIRLNPRYAEAWYSRGNAYGKTDRLADAVRDFSKAIELQPDYVNAYNDRAVARYCLKDYAGALADVRAAQKLGGSPPPGFLEALTRAAQQSKRAEP